MVAWILSITFVILLGLLYSLNRKYKELYYQYDKVLYQMKELEKKDITHEHIINSTIHEIREVSRHLQDMRRTSEYPDHEIHDLVDKLDKIEIIVYDRW